MSKSFIPFFYTLPIEINRAFVIVLATHEPKLILTSQRVKSNFLLIGRKQTESLRLLSRASELDRRSKLATTSKTIVKLDSITTSFRIQKIVAGRVVSLSLQSGVQILAPTIKRFQAIL